MAKCECNKLQEALGSAKSGKEMLDLFEKMEPELEEEKVGFGLLQVSQRLDIDGHDPEKVLCLAKRALDIFLDRESRGIILPSPIGWVSAVTCVLSVLGSCCIKLENYDEGLKYLEWADKNLKKVEEDGSYRPEEHDEFMHCIHTVQLLLSKVKEAMGRLDEWVLHLRKILEVTEKKRGMEQGSVAIGKACMDVCQAYIVTLNAREALPFALKALEIYVKHFGSESVEVVLIRRSLGLIYNSLGQSENDMGLIEKALEQAQLVSSFFGSGGCTYENLVLEFERANKLNQLGRYEESIGVLKGVVSSDEAHGALLAGAWISMASAYCFQNKFEEARDLMETAKKTLEKEQIEPYQMAIALGEMSMMHQKMNDSDTAISLLRRSLALPNLPEKLILEDSERLLALIAESCKGERAIQYLEEAVERLKQSLGPKHPVVGNGYNKLGAVASKLNRPLQALIYHENAKHILDASLGPRHLNSLGTTQLISILYSSIGRHARAIECQAKVVEAFKELGPRYMDELHRAVSLLYQLRGAADH